MSPRQHFGWSAVGRALLIAGAVLAGSTSASASPVTLQFVTKQFPPYAYSGPEGRPAGPMVDLLFAACAKAQLPCTVSVLPWRRALRLTETGEVDGIFPIVDSPQRRADFDLSVDVVRGRYVLLGMACERDCSEVQPPAAHTIAAFGPSEAVRSLRSVVAQSPGAQAQIESDHQIVVRKLLAGRYGANGLALVNEAVARWQILGADPRRLQTVAVVRDFDYTYALVRKPGREDLLPRFSDALNQLCRSGETAQIFKPYGLLASNCQPASASKRTPRFSPPRYYHEIFR